MGVITENSAFDSKKYSPLVYEDQPDFRPGSIAYDDYWDEQDHRCRFGYAPENMPEITGEHYFYLNLLKISLLKPGARRKTPGCPFYRSLDRRLSYEVKDAKDNGHGLIIGKPRRVGLSWFGAMLAVYELLFSYHNTVGVCAGKQDKADDFYKKVQWLLSTINPAYATGILTKNNEELKLGYSYRENKQNIEAGILSSMFIKTMYADSSAFEGKELAFVIFEEAGLFENLIQSYKATEPCFKDGGIQFGVPMIYGTGGEIEKGSKGYKEMWDKHEAFNLKKVFIPAYEHYPGDGETNKEGVKITFFNMKTGETNKEAALAHILEERKRASLSREAYTKHVQSYPIKESEIFIKSKGGVLDRIKLNTQLIRLNDNDIPVEPLVGRLEWIDSDVTQRVLLRARDTKEKTLLRIKNNSKVKFIEDPNGTVFKVDDPINQDGMAYKPDIGGVDSYDDEVNFEDNNNSFGASMIYRCYGGPSQKLYNCPVAYLKERGDSSSDDVFYENTVKLAVMYNAEMLIEYSKTAIMTYFKDVNAHKYMRLRPNLESTLGPTNSRNEFGQRVNLKEKRLITKLLKSDVHENSFNYFFKDHLIELIDYGDINTDLAMAHGLCLIHKLDLFPEISEDLDNFDEVEQDPLLSMSYYDIENGKLQIKTYEDFGQQDFEYEIFDPRKHASMEERMQMKKKITDDIDAKDQLKKEIEEKYGKDAMSLILHDYKNS